MKYIVSHQGLSLEPLSLDVIANRVCSKEFGLDDYIYDESRGDWVLLMEFPSLLEKIKSTKPPIPHAASPRPSAPAESPHTVREWHVLKGENRFGPFTYHDVVKMLQQKVIFPFDFIWHAGLTSWTRLNDMTDFSEEKIRALFAQEKIKDGIFMQRKFQRHRYVGRVIIHNNISFWKGEGFEISRGGVGINMSNSLLVPSQQVHVHFKQHENWPAFNAVCEVVSKKFVKDDSPVQYGLRFLSLSQQGQEEFYRKVA